MLIDATGTHQTWELTCGNNHVYKVDLDHVDEMEIHESSETGSSSYMWSQIKCPECKNQEILNIYLPDN